MIIRESTVLAFWQTPMSCHLLSEASVVLYSKEYVKTFKVKYIAYGINRLITREVTDLKFPNKCPCNL